MGISLLWDTYLFTCLFPEGLKFLSLLRVEFCTIHICVNLILYVIKLLLYANHFWLYEIVLKLSGDTEEHPGPKPWSNLSYSIFHWNLSSISVHNYIKISLLRAYITTHKFDVTCISETFRLWYIWWWRQSKNCRLQFNSSRLSI